jgi:hypothetical protein
MTHIFWPELHANECPYLKLSRALTVPVRVRYPEPANGISLEVELD